jgi:hypothetical protein
MPAEVQSTNKAKLCSFPACGAMADWCSDFFGETEYYCDIHKPMIPRSFLKKANTSATSDSVR